MNQTNDPSIKSFIPVPDNSHYPIQNLPYGVFCSKNNLKPRVGVAIGDRILDLSVLENKGIFKAIIDPSFGIFSQPSLNALMALPQSFQTGGMPDYQKPV